MKRFMPILCGILFGCCCALGVHLWDITAESDRVAEWRLTVEQEKSQLCDSCMRVGYSDGYRDALIEREQNIAMLN